MNRSYLSLLRGWLRGRAALVLGGALVGFLVSGCFAPEAEARHSRQEAEARARAEAARKEMDAVPKVFKSRDYFKKNESEKKAEAATASPK